jgi:hypothetical protein
MLRLCIELVQPSDDRGHHAHAVSNKRPKPGLGVTSIQALVLDHEMVFVLILLLRSGLLSIERWSHRQAAATAPPVGPASLPAKLLAAGKLSNGKTPRIAAAGCSAWLRKLS